MTTTMIRVDSKTHKALKKLADARQQSVGQVVSRLTAKAEEEQFWKDVRSSYERIRNDPVEWESWQSETSAWDATLMDGLQDEPAWGEQSDGE